MNLIERINDKCRVKVREKLLNPILGRGRKRKLDNPKFTIISNNCWGGHVYRYFQIPYDSPTVGLFFFTDEYIRFLSDLKRYTQENIRFIPIRESKYRDEIQKRGIQSPVGIVGDVEIVFLHYKSEEEVINKWKRRCSRIHWDHLIVKMSEQNLCSLVALKRFDALPYKNKFVFTSQDYGLRSQVIFYDYEGDGEVKNDTLHFRKYVDLIKLVNGNPNFVRR